jgi:hypothetical protein
MTILWHPVDSENHQTLVLLCSDILGFLTLTGAVINRIILANEITVVSLVQKNRDDYNAHGTGRYNTLSLDGSELAFDFSVMIETHCPNKESYG